jgi:adhesin/invasin
VYVGAQSYNHAEGAVYGYTEADTTDGWATDVSQTTLLPPTSATGQAFGASLAVQGNTLVVGDEALAEATAMSVGAAFVYTVPTNGDLASAVEDAELQPSATAASEPFWGGSVAIDGSTIVVGSGQGNQIAGDYPYVYTKPNGGGWAGATGTALPVAPDFGGVAVSGDTVVIGQPGYQGGDVVSFSQPATHVSVALSPASVTADGQSTSVATATVTGASGDPATADNVTFSAGSAGVAIGPVTNNGDGTYTATLTSVLSD